MAERGNNSAANGVVRPPVGVRNQAVAQAEQKPLWCIASGPKLWFESLGFPLRFRRVLAHNPRGGGSYVRQAEAVFAVALEQPREDGRRI